MAGVIDTNILLYAANRSSRHHHAARKFLERAAVSADSWYLSDGIIYEFFRVATHPRVFDKPLRWEQAFNFLRPLIESSNFHLLGVADHHWALLEQVLAKLNYPVGNLFFDIKTVVLMQQHGIREIYTADTDFLQFDEVDVVNPLG